MPVDKFERMSDAKTRDTGVSLTYINNNYIRSDGGTPVSGSINMNGNTLYNVSDPVNPQDVATKEYADTTNKAFVILYPNENTRKEVKNLVCNFDNSDDVRKMERLTHALNAQEGELKIYEKIEEKLKEFKKYIDEKEEKLNYLLNLIKIYDYN